MSSLLNLPRELRDQIYNYVIHAQTESASLDQSFDELIKGYRHPRKDLGTPGVLYRPRDHISNTHSLRLVCRQLHAETRQNLARITTTYDLDVIVLDEMLLLQTWTRIPALTTKIDQVNATFRISGSCDDERRGRRTAETTGSKTGTYAQFGHVIGWIAGDGGPPGFVWQVYSLLKRFVCLGPLDEACTRENKHHHFTAKTLNINVQTPPGIDPARFAPPKLDWVARRGVPAAEDSVLDPEAGSRSWFSYGKILYEHVNEIFISKDGQEVYRADVMEQLKQFGGNEQHVTKEELRDYKENTWRERKKRGLKVPLDWNAE